VSGEGEIVRDGVPQRVEVLGIEPRFERVTADHKLRLLRKKLGYELAEFYEADGDEEQMGELADLIEVAFQISYELRRRNSSLRSLLERKANKKARVGGFDGGTVLAWSTHEQRENEEGMGAIVEIFPTA
jgi:predicted house-cleaning noncanonical NTP pyrophosphatase (MazG superfamily)